MARWVFAGQIRGHLSNSLENLSEIKAREASIRLSVFIVLTLISTFYYITESQVRIDDSYIYLRSVENFLATGDMSFNTGESRNLMTSAGWFLILSASKFMVPFAEIVTIAGIWSAVFLIGSSVLLFLILRDRLPGIAMFAPLPAFFMPSIPGLAGHDTALALCMSLFMIWGYLERRPILFPVAAVAAYLARGEIATFAIVLGLAYLCADGAANRLILARAKELAAGLAIALIIFFMWHGYYYYLTGSILPDTLSAKTLQAASGYWPWFPLKIGVHLNLVFGAFWPWAFGFSLLGLWVIWRRAWPLAAWPLVHYLTLTGLGVPWYHWYYYPVEFALIIGIVAAGAFVASAAWRHLGGVPGMAARAVTVLGVCVIAVVPIGMALLPAGLYSADSASGMREEIHPDSIASRFAIYREMADWITENHNKPAAPVILAFEIGIIGYYMPGALVYDVVGLASPAETPADMWNYRKYAGLYSPDYLVSMHATDPPGELVYRSRSGKTLRYVAELIRPKMPSGINIVLYRLDPS